MACSTSASAQIHDRLARSLLIAPQREGVERQGIAVWNGVLFSTRTASTRASMAVNARVVTLCSLGWSMSRPDVPTI